MWRIAIVLLCMTIGVVEAQVLTTAVDPNAATQAAPSTTATPLSPLLGKWKGDWVSNNSSRQYAGAMEMEVFAEDGDRVSGRVRATYSTGGNCSVAWESLTGVKKGEKVFAQYNLRGGCGKVDTIFSIDPEGVMEGAYTNEHSARGSIRLTKQQ